MRRKLFLATLAIILFTLMLSIAAVEFVFQKQFANYVTQANEAMLNQLPARISGIYLKNHTWDLDTLQTINYDLPMEVYVTLKDDQDRVIANLENPMNAMHTRTGMMNRIAMDVTVKEWKNKELPIPGPNGIIATAFIRYPVVAQILNPQDALFSKSIFNSLLLAGLLALILGIIMSYIISRKLAAPLLSLTEAANRIGSGHLDERVPVQSEDEIGRLAQAFNGMADSLNRQENLRKQFSADIAHEIRTPLTSIRSFIEAFEDGVLAPNSENYAIINSEISRLVALASDLKDLNIAEIGEMKMMLEQLNLVSLVDNVIRSLSPLICDKDLTLSYVYKVPEIEIQGDNRLLTRLFYNLIHNAYRYTETGGEIWIEAEASEQEVRITIKDTGIGIPVEDQDNIFERFYRTDRSRARETGGCGIGLALVKQIVTLHQGTLAVESALGKGSTFIVKLPITQKG